MRRTLFLLPSVVLAILPTLLGCGSVGRSVQAPSTGAPTVTTPAPAYPSSTFTRLPGQRGAVDSFGVSLTPDASRPIDSFLLDELGQLYRWSPEHTLTKFVVAADVLSGVAPEMRYRNQRLGALQQVDLTNPLRPVLFYAGAQTVVWLDRNLAELRTLPLVDLDLGRIDAIAYAPSDGLWLYAPDRQQLLQVDRQGRTVQQSPVFSQLFEMPIRVEELVATAQQVSLATRDGRILLFGPFGAYRTQILRPGRYLMADGDRLLFVDEGRWWAYGNDLTLVQAVNTGATSRELLMFRADRELWRQGDRVWVE